MASNLGDATYTNGLDLGDVSFNLGSVYTSNLNKSYLSGFIHENLFDFAGPYSSSGPAKTFYIGMDTSFSGLDIGSTYIPSPVRYKVNQMGTVEASMQSRILQPGDNGIDLSYFNMDQQRAVLFMNY